MMTYLNDVPPYCSAPNRLTDRHTGHSRSILPRFVVKIFAGAANIDNAMPLDPSWSRLWAFMIDQRSSLKDGREKL